MGKIILPDHAVVEFASKIVCVHRLKFYEKFDPLRVLRGEVPGELVFDTGPLHNLTMTAGKDLVLDRLFALSGPPAAIVSVGIGTDSTAVTAAQLQLNPSVGGSVLLQTADGGTARSAETVTIGATFATGSGNFAIAEGGLFNGNTNGTSKMLNRLLIGPITKTSAMTLLYQIAYTQN